MTNYEKMGLYPHNEVASVDVKESFNSGVDTVSLIRATGTGKSYIALSIALEYREMKSIYVVPTVAIIEHIKEILKKCNLSLEEDFPNLELIIVL